MAGHEPDPLGIETQGDLEGVPGVPGRHVPWGETRGGVFLFRHELGMCESGVKLPNLVVARVCVSLVQVKNVDWDKRLDLSHVSVTLFMLFSWVSYTFTVVCAFPVAHFLGSSFWGECSAESMLSLSTLSHRYFFLDMSLEGAHPDSWHPLAEGSPDSALTSAVSTTVALWGCPILG